MPWKGVQRDQVAKQPLTCQELDHLHAGEVALTLLKLHVRIALCARNLTPAVLQMSLRCLPQSTRAQ